MRDEGRRKKKGRRKEIGTSDGGQRKDTDLKYWKVDDIPTFRKMYKIGG
jgi:hypothetical protein